MQPERVRSLPPRGDLQLPPGEGLRLKRLLSHVNSSACRGGPRRMGRHPFLVQTPRASERWLSGLGTPGMPRGHMVGPGKEGAPQAAAPRRGTPWRRQGPQPGEDTVSRDQGHLAAWLGLPQGSDPHSRPWEWRRVSGADTPQDGAVGPHEPACRPRGAEAAVCSGRPPGTFGDPGGDAVSAGHHPLAAGQAAQVSSSSSLTSAPLSGLVSRSRRKSSRMASSSVSSSRTFSRW